MRGACGNALNIACGQREKMTGRRRRGSGIVRCVCDNARLRVCKCVVTVFRVVVLVTQFTRVHGGPDPLQCPLNWFYPPVLLEKNLKIKGFLAMAGAQNQEAGEAAQAERKMK